MAVFHDVVLGGQSSRRTDAHGSGQYGASRGSRTHKGIDIVTKEGQAILSPIDGMVVKESRPYKDKPSVTGLLIRGTGEWADYEIKIFYALGLFSGPVKAGQPVAIAQDLTKLYPDITNHVHVEARRSGEVVDPLEAFGRCF